MSRRTLEWPDEPYKGIAYYQAEDALLFCGRESDVEECVELLSDQRSRILLLYGTTGCGKSSFLRAGLIPTLETRGFGFQFLRRYESDSDEEGTPVFIQCGSDPVSRIAEALYEYVSVPRALPTERGRKRLDLSAATLGHDSVEGFVTACQGQGELMRAMAALSRLLRHTLVLIVDQAEEVFTLKGEDEEVSWRFFDFLKEFNGVKLDLKLVLAFRREHFSDYFRNIQLDASLRTNIKHFELPELQRGAVLAAIEAPTSEIAPDPEHTAPFEKYQFRYEPDLAGKIADDLFKVGPAGGILPAMQIVCQDLYHEARQPDKPAPWLITRQLYTEGGEVSGRVNRHITTSLWAGLKDAGVPTGNLAAAERKWRSVLLKLALRDPDGRVKSDQVGLGRLEKDMEEAGIPPAEKSVLAFLSLPKVLVLRVVPGQPDETVYKLGHDAVGLALYEWGLAEQEAARRERAEQRANRLRLYVTGAFAMALACALGGWLAVVYISHASDMSVIKAKIRTLESAMDRTAQTDPRKAAAMGIAAVQLSLKFDPWLTEKRPDELTRLEALRTQINGDFIVQSDLSFDTQSDEDVFRSDRVRALPLLDSFLFYDGKEVVKIIKALPEAADQKASASSYTLPADPENTKSGNFDVKGLADGTVLMQRSERLDVLFKGGATQEFKLADLVRLAGIPVQADDTRQYSFNVLDGGIVIIYRFMDGLDLAALVFDSKLAESDPSHPFREGVSFRESQGGMFDRDYELSGNVLVAQTPNDRSEDSTTSNPDPKEWSGNERAVLVTLDQTDSAAQPFWSTIMGAVAQSDLVPDMKACAPTARPSVARKKIAQRSCDLKAIDRPLGEPALFGFGTPASAQTAPAASDPDTKPKFDKAFIVSPSDWRIIPVDLTGLGTVGSSTDTARAVDMFDDLSAYGKIDDLTLVKRINKGFHLFRYAENKWTLSRSFFPPARTAAISIGQGHFLVADDKIGRVWNLSERQHVDSSAPGSNPAGIEARLKVLTDDLCATDSVYAGWNGTTWYGDTGLTSDKPDDPCTPHGTQDTSSTTSSKN